MSIGSLRSSCARAFELLLLLILLATPGMAAVGEVSMVLSKISGTVEVSTAAHPDWQAATEGLTLRAEDKVRTGVDSTARVSYPDAELRITPESTAVLGYTSVRMNVGTLWVRMRKSGRTFEILTPTVAVTIRGTLVRATAGAGGSVVHLLEGIVDVKVGSRVETLQPHQQLEAPLGGALAIGRIDRAVEAKLAAEFAAGKSEGGSGAAPVPAPKKGAEQGSQEQGSRSSADDAGQRALTAGLQNLERDLDARSTGMGVTGGSEAAMDGSARGASRGSAADTSSAVAGGGLGGGATGMGGSSASVRALVSRPGGLSTVGAADVSAVGAVGGVGNVGGVGDVGGADVGAVGGVGGDAGDAGGDGGNGRGRGRGRGRGVGLLRRFIRR